MRTVSLSGMPFISQGHMLLTVAYRTAERAKEHVSASGSPSTPGVTKCNDVIAQWERNFQESAF